MGQSTVFVSYCHKDFEGDELHRLEYIIEILERKCNSQYRIIWDKTHLTTGDDIDDFMVKTAENCDAAILLLSPTYKKKVENREVEGVFKEFNVLYSRYLTLKERNNKLKLLYPIIISGSVMSAVPNEIKKIKHEDLSQLHLRILPQFKTIQIPQQERRKTEDVIQRIHQAILASTIFKSPEFKQRSKSLQIKLFKETKSEWHKEEYFSTLENLIVKTRPLQAIKENKSQFIIGRKGSGKSTLVDVLPYIKKEEILFNIPISLDGFQLDKMYAIFYTSPELFASNNQVITKLKAFKYIWDVFLHLSILIRLAQLSNEINDRRIHRISPFFKSNFSLDIKTIKPKETKIYSDIYFSVFHLLISFLKKSKVKASNDVNVSFSLSRLISLENFRNYCIPDDFLIEKFGDILVRINQKPLITLDGYDTESDIFIREGHYSGDSELRQEFQRIWLHSLMLLILDKGINGESENSFHEQFLYCITIPKDRFYSLRKVDRDSYRHRGKFILVRWTGIELSILVRKRLEELSGYYTNKKSNPKERLLEINKNEYSQLNIPIIINYNNNKQYSQELFLYVLRHSFWRPRDILFTYGMLLSAAEGMSKKNYKLDSSFIKTIVREAAADFIEREFINEFKATYKNFEDVIYVFWKSEQILNHAEIYRKLNSHNFEANDRLINLTDFNSKIEFLFDIGFIGVSVSEELKEKYNTHDFAFTFNEGNFLKDKVKRPDYHSVLYVIHPIFRDFLRLEIDKDSPPVLLYDWDYLIKNENIHHHIRTI